MKQIALALFFLASLFGSEIIIQPSCYDVATTTHRLKSILKAKDLQIFATINHQANAKMVGLKMEPSMMIIFGKAKVGTMLMQQDPTVGLDLPLRILIYKENGVTKMAYRDGSWLKSHHAIKSQKLISKINTLLNNLTRKAGQCND